MKVHDCKQGTPEWLQLRLGIPTASDFDQLITPEWKIRTGAMPETYMYSKLIERLLGYSPKEVGGTFEMGQGVILENEARPWFEFAHDTKVQTVGFCTTDDGRIGCSPDGLIGDDGGIEIKCPQPERALRYIVEGGVPKEYLAQVHGSMYVTGRNWWIFLSYSRQFPAHVVRVERDEKICSAIGTALSMWMQRFDERLAQITALRDAENAVRRAEHEAKGDHTK